jgi:hypothetical protein
MNNFLTFVDAAKLLGPLQTPLNQYYNAGSLGNTAAMSPASAVGLIQAAMTPPPSHPGSTFGKSGSIYLH